MNTVTYFVTAAFLGLTLATASQAAEVATPLPLLHFCSTNPGQCTAHRDATIPWSLRLNNTLKSVNAQVNAAIRPMANPRRGWAINPGYGDCNDYVLSKRSRLIELGLPPGALRLAVTTTSSGQRHLILLVKTSAGEIVLDNLSPRITTLRNSRYAIRARSSANPRRWTAG